MFDDTAYTPAPTPYEAHNQWHAIHGALHCPLDCGAGEAAASDYEEDFLPLVSCGHCKGRHTVAGVRACSVGSR